MSLTAVQTWEGDCDWPCWQQQARAFMDPQACIRASEVSFCIETVHAEADRVMTAVCLHCRGPGGMLLCQNSSSILHRGTGTNECCRASFMVVVSQVFTKRCSYMPTASQEATQNV
jgi:hypothetical protein